MPGGEARWAHVRPRCPARPDAPSLSAPSFMSSRVFIFHDGALGDLLLSVPALKAIGAQASRIHLAGRPDAAGLLAKAGHVNDVSDAGGARYAGLFSPSPDPEARKILHGFDRAYVFSAKGNSPLLRSIGSVIRDTQLVLTIPPRGVESHVSAFRLHQVVRAHGDPFQTLSSRWPAAFPDFVPVSASRLRERMPQSAVIAVHPGSGSPRKNWPLGRFLEVMTELVGSGAAVLILLSGPGEPPETKAALHDFALRHRERAIHLEGEPLPAIASALGTADLYLGNDSGITHLASLLCPRVVAVYGPTDPAIWGPVGGGRAIQNRSICTQCAEPESSCTHRSCLLSIPSEAVLREISQLLGQAGEGLPRSD